MPRAWAAAGGAPVHGAVRDDEAPLTGRIFDLAWVYGRYGSPRITGMLRNEGWNVNRKWGERIWRQTGLKVARKQPRRVL